MKKVGKSENWLRGLRRKITRRKLSSRSMGNYSSTALNVGEKEEELEKRSSTLLLDDVHQCPLSIYIDVTCDDKLLKKLIVKGKPSQTELEEARFKLVTDFSELSNNGESKAIAEAISNFYYQRNLIVGFELALNLVLVGKFDKSIEYLNDNGVKCSTPETEEEYQKLIKAIQMRLKNRMVKYKEARAQYKAFSSGKNEKPTRQYYNRLLIMLSTCEVIKLQLNPKKMTVAEFAEYLNMFNEYQNHLKMRETKI